MTLLESLVALVVLGLAAVGFLEAFHTASRSTLDAAVWVQAVGYAEAAMEEAKLGTGAADRSLTDALPPGFALEIEVRPWLGTEAIERITVTVALPGGGAFVLHRLQQRSP